MVDLGDSVLGAPSVRGEPDAERAALIDAAITSLMELARLNPDVEDLRVALSALEELLRASTLFASWRDHPKLAVFGSARTAPDSPLFAMATDLSARMVERGWMTVSGAGPGIMEASAMGAGPEHTLGVNIELPFEQFANPYINAETMLVAMQHFFTRKVAMTRRSNAFAIFPGGLGTMDEAFEVLTLLHTGKTSPAPVVLVDEPDGTFWTTWADFVTKELVGQRYIDDGDLTLVRLCRSVDEAVVEISHFYSNYVAFTLDGDRARVALRRAPDDGEVAEFQRALTRLFGRRRLSVADSSIEFDFDGRNYVNLRRLIDVVNNWTA